MLDEGIEQFANPEVLVLLGGRAEDRDHRAGCQRLGQSPGQLIHGQIAFAQVFFHERFVGLDDAIDEQRALVGDIDGTAGGNGGGGIEDGDDAAERWADVERGVEQDAGLAERIANGFQEIVEMDVLVVELIDDDHTGEVAFAGLVEQAARVDLDAGVSGDDDDRGIDRVEPADRLADEVGFARGVDQVHILLP